LQLVGAIVAACTFGWTVYKDSKTTLATKSEPVPVPVPESVAAPAPVGNPNVTPATRAEALPPAPAPSAEPCEEFLSAGGQYTLHATTIGGPGEPGRNQTFPISQNGSTGKCLLTGTYADGAWNLTLNGCQRGMTLFATRTGEGNLTGEGSCTVHQATGTMGYTDARNQAWPYRFTITRS
jgi:hypothetical protein